MIVSTPQPGCRQFSKSQGGQPTDHDRHAFQVAIDRVRRTKPAAKAEPPSVAGWARPGHESEFSVAVCALVYQRNLNG